MNGRRVVKVGGSLLELSDLAERIQNWLETKRPAANIFLIGGGEICNEMRTLDARFQLSEEFSHDRCIELMKITASILSQILQLEIFYRFKDLFGISNNVVFDCSDWICEKKNSIPRNWDFTSDSISALLARECDAELTLLKSVDEGAKGTTDNYFEQYSAGLNVEYVNLRR